MHSIARNNMNRKRKSYLEKGKALLAAGKKNDANDCFQKCVNVTPEMALAFIKVASTQTMMNTTLTWLFCCLVCLLNVDDLCCTGVASSANTGHSSSL